jgi:hypothetical protein
LRIAFLRIADRVGCTISFTCAVHCVGGPLLLTILPFAYAAERFELPLILTALVIAAATFTAGFVRHGALLPLILLMPAAVAMIASRSVDVTTAEIPLLVMGSMTLGAGHLFNLRASREC